MPWFLLGKQSIPKVPKIASSQWRFTISQKKLWMAFILCMQINIKVSTSWYYYFWWKWPHKSIATASLFYCDAKHSGILRGPSLVVLGGCSQKWVHPFKLLNSKICFIYIYIYICIKKSRMNWWNELSFACWYKFLDGYAQNGGDLFDHGTILPVVSHKSFDKSRRSIEFLHADSHRIIFGLTTNLYLQKYLFRGVLRERCSENK